MAKRKSKKKAATNNKPALVESRETLQTWGLHDSQMSILLQTQERHKEELKPLQQYHKIQMNKFLADIANELGIPSYIKVRFEGKKFIEIKPDPKPSPTTQDLTKTPA